MKLIDFVNKYGGTALAQLIPAANLMMPNANLFFVDGSKSTALDAQDGEYGNSWEKPFKTIDYVVALCTANQGDVILVGPGHSEPITAAGSLTLDVSGMSVIGVGVGRQLPTLAFATAVAASCVISGNDVLLKNFKITNAIAALVKCFSVTGVGVTIDGVNMYSPASTINSFLVTTTAADFLTVQNCHHVHTAGQGAAATWISMVGNDYARVLDNTINIVLSNSASCIIIGGDASVVHLEVGRNFLKSITSAAAAQGIVVANSGTNYSHDNRVVLVGATAITQGNSIGNTGYTAQTFVSRTVTTKAIETPVTADT